MGTLYQAFSSLDHQPLAAVDPMPRNLTSEQTSLANQGELQSSFDGVHFSLHRTYYGALMWLWTDPMVILSAVNSDFNGWPSQKRYTLRKDNSRFARDLRIPHGGSASLTGASLKSWDSRIHKGEVSRSWAWVGAKQSAWEDEAGTAERDLTLSGAVMECWTSGQRLMLVWKSLPVDRWLTTNGAKCYFKKITAKTGPNSLVVGARKFEFHRFERKSRHDTSGANHVRIFAALDDRL